MTSSVRAKMAQVEKEKKVARREAMANPEVATEMVRARNDQGHYTIHRRIQVFIPEF